MPLDAFQLLGLPPRAALDEAALRSAYATRSREAHPDHGGSEAQAAELNAAHDILRTPERRLKHLLELTGPPEASAWRTVPLDGSMMDLFMKLGGALETSSVFLARKSRTTSALSRALLAAEELRHREALEALGFQLEEHRQAMEQNLPSLDEALQSPDSVTWKRLAETQARFAYLAKWQAQIRERLLALM